MNTLSNHLSEVISAKKKGWSSRLAKRVGESSFKTLGIMLQQLLISNDSNRDVELEEESTLLNKLNHLVRFVSGISSKSQMLITVLRDGLDDIGYYQDQIDEGYPYPLDVEDHEGEIEDKLIHDFFSHLGSSKDEKSQLLYESFQNRFGVSK